MEIEKEIYNRKFENSHQKVVVNLLYTYGWITNLLRLRLNNHSITLQQYNVLRILRGQKGNPANMCVIQERMLAKTSNTTRLVDKLLLKELVTRKVCKENRRKIEVLITEKGLAILKELDPKVDDYGNNIVARLTTNELEQLNHILEKIRIK